MLKKNIALTILLVLSTKILFGQVTGKGTYQFLNLPTSARATALGGKLGAIDESDISTVFQNPALLDSSMHNNLTLSFIDYYSGVKYGSFTYARYVDKIGTFAAGIQSVDYGSFTRSDEAGTIQGSFTASDMAFNMVYSRTFDTCFHVGITLKTIYSHLENYTSWGIAADIAATYRSPNRLFAAGIAFKNVGSMINSYTPDTREDLPFEIIAGISKKLAHAPFRFVVTLQQLQNFDLYYKSKISADESTLGESDSNSQSKISELEHEFISHVILGAEFVPVRNFYLRFGYNYQRRNELKIEENTSTVGFSWGVGIKISKFNINYSRATMHLAGATSHFTVTADLDSFFRKH
ncbi:MAG: type IX secretion system protein PorQ [Bacteroidales bacterium]